MIQYKVGDNVSPFTQITAFRVLLNGWLNCYSTQVVEIYDQRVTLCSQHLMITFAGPAEEMAALTRVALAYAWLADEPARRKAIVAEAMQVPPVDKRSVEATYGGVDHGSGLAMLALILSCDISATHPMPEALWIDFCFRRLSLEELVLIAQIAHVTTWTIGNLIRMFTQDMSGALKTLTRLDPLRERDDFIEYCAMEPKRNPGTVAREVGLLG